MEDKKIQVIDPEGRVILVLRNHNNPFAVWDEAPNSDSEPDAVDASPSVESRDDNETISEPESDETHPNADIRFQVSARHLSLPSSVFRSMLDAEKKKNKLKDLREPESMEIVTEGWDSEAFWIFLCILHCLHCRIPRVLDLETLAKLSAIADHFRCLHTLRFLGDVWLDALKVNFPLKYSRDVILWIWVSWVFHQSSEFHDASLLAIKHSRDTIPDLGLPIPADVIDEMTQRREDFIQQIIDLIYGRFNEVLHDSKDCCARCNAATLGILARKMNSHLLFPKML